MQVLSCPQTRGAPARPPHRAGAGPEPPGLAGLLWAQQPTRPLRTVRKIGPSGREPHPAGEMRQRDLRKMRLQEDFGVGEIEKRNHENRERREGRKRGRRERKAPYGSSTA